MTTTEVSALADLRELREQYQQVAALERHDATVHCLSGNAELSRLHDSRAAVWQSAADGIAERIQRHEKRGLIGASE